MKTKVVTLFVLLIIGCQTSELETRMDPFFEYNGSQEIVEDVIKDLLPTVSNQTKDEYVKQLGYPKWAFSTYHSAPTPTLFIPIYNGTKVTGIIKAAKQGKGYRYKLLKRGKLLRYGFSENKSVVNCRAYAGLFQHFDLKFGNEEFELYEVITDDPIARVALAKSIEKDQGRVYEVTTCSVTCTSTDSGVSWYCHTHDCTITYESVNEPEPATLEGPGGSGGGGGTAGDYGIDDDGIDCASFDFINVNNNYQEAAINNVHFFVRFFDASTGKGYTRQMFLDRTLFIGFPAVTYEGQTISHGKAAQAAASAIQYASDRVHSMFIESPNVLNSAVVTAFMNELKSYVQALGGRADFIGSGSPLVAPTNAQYTLVGNGNCAD